MKPVEVADPPNNDPPLTENVAPGEVVPTPTLFVNQSTTNVFPSTVNPPAIVEVAVVDVASKTPTFKYPKVEEAANKPFAK